jgi:hypothetical protein
VEQDRSSIELTAEAQSRMAASIATSREAKREAGAAPAKTRTQQLAAAEVKRRLLAGAVDVVYGSTYFDTQPGDDYSFPEDAHDFCRVGFDLTAPQDYALDAQIGPGAALGVQLDWTAAADYDLYLFDTDGRPVGDPDGILPDGSNGVNYQQAGDPLTEEAAVVNGGDETGLFVVVDRFRGETGGDLTITFTGDDGVFEVLEYIGIDHFIYLDANLDQSLGDLTEGTTINLDQLGSPRPNFNVMLDTDGCAESISFLLIDAATEMPVQEFTDNEWPYALFGDVEGDFNAGNLAEGDYSLTAIPFSEDDAAGVAGAPTTVSFTITNDLVESDSARVVSFTLIDAAANQPVEGFDPIPDDGVIDLVALVAQARH